MYFFFQLTVTDYNGFVLSVKGEKVVTDVTANDGKWHFIALTWDSYTGTLTSYALSSRQSFRLVD